MKKITLNTPDGKTITLNAPDGATPEQIKEYATKAVSSYKQKLNPQPAAPEAVTIQQPQQKGMLGKAWDALAVPAQKSKEGWDMIAQSEAVQPKLSGNLATDVIRGTPKVLAETAAEVAPSFIDRTAITTAGLGAGVKQVGKAGGAVVGKFGGMLERGSGLQKGTLEAAFKDPKMIMDFGSKLKATKLYEELKQGASVPAHLRTNAKLASDAMNQMSKGNHLTAPDAFKARKAVRALMKSKQYPMDDLLEAEKGLEAMVFRSANKADQLYVRAIRAEQMRNISRLNKNGTTGPISAGIMAKIPMLAPFLSPAIQGVSASAAGAAAQIPLAKAAKGAAMLSAEAEHGGKPFDLVGQGLDRLKNRKEKSRGKR